MDLQLQREAFPRTRIGVIRRMQYLRRGFSTLVLLVYTINALFPIGTVITCTVPDGCVEEGNSVNVTCTRSLDLTQQSRVQVNTEDGSATG